MAITCHVVVEGTGETRESDFAAVPRSGDYVWVQTAAGREQFRVDRAVFAALGTEGPSVEIFISAVIAGTV